MKVSGFTFIRNGEQLGYPFLLSIKSALPICDEFIVAVGRSDDQTLSAIDSIGSDKIKVINTDWNPHAQRTFVFGEQKMLAQFACTGDWALYIEGDEVLHEKDLPNIQQAMEQHVDNDDVEALIFDYLHFYGNINTYAWSPAWYRRAPRIIKRSVRCYCPTGLFWAVLEKHKRARYPKAALANATMYHYGHVRTKEQMALKRSHMHQYGCDLDFDESQFDYANIDPKTLHAFNKSHPQGIEAFFPPTEAVLQGNPNYRLSRRERKNRIGLAIEKLIGCELSKKHFTLVDNNKT